MKNKYINEFRHYPIQYEGSEEIVKKISMQAFDILQQLNEPILIERLEWEKNAIIVNGFADILLAGRDFVKMLKQDGYEPKATGSIRNSYMAYLLNITDINPLPIVGENMAKEIVYGFKGNKVPQLRFSFSENLRGKIDFYKYLKENKGIGDVIDFRKDTRYADEEYYLVPIGFDVDYFKQISYKNMLSVLQHVEIMYISQEEFSVRNHSITLDELLCTLENAGMDREEAFVIMSKAEEGIGINEKEELAMRRACVSEELIEICKSKSCVPSKADLQV